MYLQIKEIMYLNLTGKFYFTSLQVIFFMDVVKYNNKKLFYLFLFLD